MNMLAKAPAGSIHPLNCMSGNALKNVIIQLPVLLIIFDKLTASAPIGYLEKECQV
jgi:hypothetical protein